MPIRFSVYRANESSAGLASETQMVDHTYSVSYINKSSSKVFGTLLATQPKRVTEEEPWLSKSEEYQQVVRDSLRRNTEIFKELSKR